MQSVLFMCVCMFMYAGCADNIKTLNSYMKNRRRKINQEKWRLVKPWKY